ncbi:DNA-binding transcriptional regulator CytR [Escherichia coli]|uniref:DNA-binding transcriptional regulator CytR n=1 Tax=Escherichia coli TaxID=562 RepID=A0A377BNP9_ECOLX|nr:DNA-binding transcriptional regulator CytR [Escherichia coli]
MPLCHYRLQAMFRRCVAAALWLIRNTSPVATSPSKPEAKRCSSCLIFHKPPTAVFCHSDVMALGALSQAKHQGLKVPEDLSIIGFDNIDLTQICDPR